MAYDHSRILYKPSVLLKEEVGSKSHRTIFVNAFRVTYAGRAMLTKKTGKLLPTSPNRIGSRSVGNGARRAIVEEPLTWALDVPIEWRGAKDRSRGAGKPA